MANHKSAGKRNKQSIKKNIANKSRLSKVRNSIKQIRLSIDKKDKEAAIKELPITQKLLAKLAKSGIIKSNNAARKTSRLTAQVNKL